MHLTRPLRVIAAAIIALVLVVLAWPQPSGAAVVPQATARLVNASNDPLGSVTFLGHGGHATQVRIDLRLPSTAGVNAFHGLHVHTAGQCVAPFTSAGAHWDDGTHTHGSHLGDLPSVLINADGTASMTTDVARIDVAQVAGRSVILHAGRDNFGNVPVGAAADQYTANSAAATTATEGTGNAGSRYGCGVIELVND
jgi:Cu-Zn family superoxide dismutase